MKLTRILHKPVCPSIDGSVHSDRAAIAGIELNKDRCGTGCTCTNHENGLGVAVVRLTFSQSSAIGSPERITAIPSADKAIRKPSAVSMVARMSRSMRPSKINQATSIPSGCFTAAKRCCPLSYFICSSWLSQNQAGLAQL